MSNPTPSLTPLDAIRILQQYRLRWLVPTVLIVLAALAVAVVRRPSWEASQALVLREEGAGKSSRPGRFDSAEAMKTAQETIMEVSKSPGVLRAALIACGPPHGKADPQWPGNGDIDTLRGAIKLKAPKGIEFGQSEVFYLTVKDESPERAVALTQSVCEQVDRCLRELREQKAASVVNELNESVQLAQKQLDEATAKLSEVERELGSDLAELRILNEATTGESNLRQTLIQVKNELRQANVDRQTSEALLQLLESAQSDPRQLVATPSNLLQAQPALQRLKDGLVDSQLRSAQLLGELSAEHPRVQAALAAQDQIASRLYTELSSAIGGIEAQLRIVASRIQLLEQQQRQLTDRMANIAGLRPTYANLSADVRNRAEILNQQQNELAQAIASRHAARMSSQLTRLDDPVAGDRPAGPGAATIVLGGILGGLLTGLGIVFLTVPLPGTSAARAHDATATLADSHRHFSPAMNPRRSPAHQVSAADLLANHVLSLKKALLRFLCISPSWN